MFGLPLYSELLHGSALRTWNFVVHVVDVLRFKVIQRITDISNMPRSRRRHHSRSRSRSKSNDRDREPKRRKVESFDSLHNRRSVSSEPEANENFDNALNDCPIENINAHSDTNFAESVLGDSSCPQTMENKNSGTDVNTTAIKNEIVRTVVKTDSELMKQTDIEKADTDNMPQNVVQEIKSSQEESMKSRDLKLSTLDESVKEDNCIHENSENSDTVNIPEEILKQPENQDNDVTIDESMIEDSANTDLDTTQASVSSDADSGSENNPDVSTTDVNTSVSSVNHNLQKEANLKPMTPKQLKRKVELEEKRKSRQLEKEELRRKLHEERENQRRKRQLEKEAKAKEEREAKEKERELKRKEKEEKEEMKRKEKEGKEEIKRKDKEKEDAKRKEKEAERLKKQAELDEKNREKQKIEEKKQKAAAAFTKFFVAKPGVTEVKKEVVTHEDSAQPTFMPFQVKSDMRLAPTTRNILTSVAKSHLVSCLLQQASEHRYLQELKAMPIRKSSKTWMAETSDDDDIVMVEMDLGDSILKPTVPAAIVMKAKFFKFHENRRPPYYGTWRKKSKNISGRRPLMQDDTVNYEVDSDDEWEEEEEGEDIAGSEDEEKEPDTETDYEVDDDFFVPHGHLSDDEQNDDEVNISPEMRKAKEKLLKNQFDEEHKSQTQKLKPRVIGCVWYNNNVEECGVDETIHKFLKPFSIISNGIISVKSRSDIVTSRYKNELNKELMPEFLRLLHGNLHNKGFIATEFIEYLALKGMDAVVGKASLMRQIKRIAQWRKCLEDGPMYKKSCWNVSDEVKSEFKHVDLSLPNQWKYCSDQKLRKSVFVNI